MVRFDLEKVVDLICRDRAFQELMVNDLSIRLSTAEYEAPENAWTAPRTKRKFTVPWRDASNQFNIWFAKWFGHYQYADHTRNTRMALANLSACWAASKKDTVVAEMDTVARLAKRLQKDAEALGQHETARVLEGRVMEMARESDNPYEALHVAYDGIFATKKVASMMRFCQDADSRQTKKDWFVPPICRRDSFAGLCVDVLIEHGRQGGKRRVATRQDPWRIFVNDAWEELPPFPKVTWSVLYSGKREEAPAALVTPGDAFVQDPKVRNIRQRMHPSRRNVFDPDGTYRTVGMDVTRAFFLSACREDVTLAWLSRKAFESAEGIAPSVSKKIMRDHFYLSENPHTSVGAQHGMECFPWAMHGWAPEYAMSTKNSEVIWALVNSVADKGDPFYRWVVDGAKGKPPEQSRGQKRGAPEVDEPGQTLGERLREVEAAKRVSEAEHAVAKVERAEGAAERDEAAAQAPPPRVVEHVPDDQFNGYVVAGGLAVAVVGVAVLTSRA